MALSSFSLTHVQYTQGDPFGFVCAGLSLAPVFLIVAYVTAILARRDLYLFTGLVGQLFNTLFNVLIKRIIKEPRPTTGHLTHSPEAVGFSPHGMPSNHAQFVFFFVGFWLPWIFTNANNQRRGSAVNNGSGNNRNVGVGGGGCVVWRHFAAVVIVLLASAVVFARVYLHYHTLPQVGVGVAIGLVVGYVWHTLTIYWIRPVLFPLVTSSNIGALFGISDLSHVEDIVAWEHATATTTDTAAWGKLLEWRKEKKEDGNGKKKN